MVIAGDTSPPKPLLQVTVPLSRDLNQGLAIAFDQGQPVHMKYVTCDLRGCLAQIEVDPQLMKTLGAAHQIYVEALRLKGEALDIAIPSRDFISVFNAPYDFAAAEEAEKKAQAARKKQQAMWGDERKPIAGSRSPPCSIVQYKQ